MLLTTRRLTVFLLVGALLLGVTRHAGLSTHGAAFVRTTLELIAFAAVTWLPGQALLWHLRLKSVSAEDLSLLAIPTTLLAYLLLGIPLLWLSAPGYVFKLALLPLLAFSGFVCWRRQRAGDTLMVPRPLLLACLLAACAVFFVCVGQAAPWKEMSWPTPARRGLHDLPIDNALQYMTAEAFLGRKEPWVIPGWTMGDRPPLFGLLTSIYAKAFLYRSLKFFDYTILGVLFNSLYVFPLVVYARRLRVSESKALIMALSVALTPIAFLNVFFTWPKAFGMFFTFTALALFTHRAPDSAWCWPSLRCAGCLGLILGLSTLLHGGSLLSVPLVVALVALFPARPALSISPSSERRWWSRAPRVAAACAVIVGSVLCVRAPWLLYKHTHPEIDTNRLLTHYVPAREGSNEPIAIREWIDAVPIEAQLRERWSQVESTALGGQFREVLHTLLTGDVVAFNEQRWPFEMFRPPSQVGELRIGLGVFSLLALAVWRGLKSLALASKVPVFDLGACSCALLVCVLSYFCNVFAKWKSVAPHELPLAEVALAAALLTMPVLVCSRLLTALLLFVTLQRFLAYLVATTFARHMPTDLFATGVFASIFAMLWVAFDGGRASAAAARHEGLGAASLAAKGR